MKKERVIQGVLAIIGAALLWSMDGIFLRPQFYNLSPEIVVFLEHGLGSVVFLGFIISGYQQIHQMSRKGRGALLRVSIFGGILGTIFITKAFFLAINGSLLFATVIILQKLQPLFALVGASLFLKERLQKNFYLWAIIAIGSTYVLAFDGQLGANIFLDWKSNGALFALFAAFAFGSSTVFSKQLTKSLDAKRSSGMRFFIVSILISIYLLFTGKFSNIMLVSSIQRIYLVIIVFSSGALALFLYYYGLERIYASQATIMELARPISAIFLDWIINGNLLTGIQRIATGILLFAMIKITKMQKL